MNSRPPLTAIIITLNEQSNIERCLKSLHSWVEEILLVDSGSNDNTVKIAEKYEARVLTNIWPGYGQQKNFAMTKAKHDWLLFVDADEEIDTELRKNIEELLKNPGEAQGAYMARKTFYLGRWIMHGGWYPNYLTRLAYRPHAKWTEPEVHERLEIAGKTVKLKGELLHYSFSSVADQVLTNLRFASLGSKVARKRGERGTLLKIIFKPLGKFLETYFWKRGFLDGFPGFVISVNAAHSIFMKYVGLRCEENSRHR